MWLAFSFLWLSQFFLCSLCWVFYYDVSGGVSFLVMMVWCSVRFLQLGDIISYLRLRKFTAITIFNRFSMPLAFISSPFSTSVIHRFGLFMVSQISCMFHSYFLSILSWSFIACYNSLTFCSIPDTLCSTFNYDIDLGYWVDFLFFFFFGLIIFHGFHIFIDFSLQLPG
jgi:hypothetical protein